MSVFPYIRENFSSGVISKISNQSRGVVEMGQEGTAPFNKVQRVLGETPNECMLVSMT